MYSIIISMLPMYWRVDGVSWTIDGNIATIQNKNMILCPHPIVLYQAVIPVFDTQRIHNFDVTTGKLYCPHASTNNGHPTI